jgi:hypothetical protein
MSQFITTLIMMAFHPIQISNEELGRWVGVARSVGDDLIIKLLTPSKQIIFWSVIRSTLDPTLRHTRLTPLGGGRILTMLTTK